MGRIVPPQTPEFIEPLVFSYVEQEFAKLNSKNKLKIENLHDGKPWVADHKHWNYEAASRAVQARLSASRVSRCRLRLTEDTMRAGCIRP